MKFDENKKGTLEIDTMDIRSRLNTSLEQDGISVSEDLINRTLEAIRQQPQPVNDAEDMDSNVGRIIPWNRYLRGFAGVAAAAFILFIGYQGISGVGIKKNAIEAPDRGPGQEMDMTQENRIENLESDIFMTSVDEGNETPTEGEKNQITAGGVVTNFRFSDISGIDPYNIETITITKVQTNQVVTITDQETFVNLYDELSESLFDYGRLEVTANYYIIEIEALETLGYRYTINVGDYITVQDESIGEIIKSDFIVHNHEEFLSDLNRLFEELIQ